MLYRFHSCAFDLIRGCLRVDGKEASLRPKSFEVLRHLVQNPGRLIPKDDLIKVVWPNTMVTDESLTNCISDVRRAIGDRDQTIIKTVPRRGYIFTAAVTTEELPDHKAAAGGDRGQGLPEQPSIAVLAFTNMSGDPNQEYFSDGITEDIITELSRFPELVVIARNSTFTYKGKAVDVRQVGRELGVRYVLEGSLRNAAGRVRVTGQLSDALRGAHIWAGRFDGALGDIFDLQDRITESVVGAIVPKLERAEIERAKCKENAKLDAYDTVLRGMAGWHTWTRDGHNDALKWFYRATELDADFARPYGLAAGCYLMRKSNGWIVDRPWEMRETERLARRAADLGRDDAVALCWSGHALAYVCGDIEAGLALVDHSLRLNPNLAVAWQRSGWLRIYAGECERAIEHLQRAMRLNPLDPLMHLAQSAIAYAYFYSGNYGEASAWADRALRSRPNWPAALRVSAMSNALADRMQVAEQAMVLLRRIHPDLRIANLDQEVSLRRPEDFARYVGAMRKAGLPE
jgi:TolB-like protein